MIRRALSAIAVAALLAAGCVTPWTRVEQPVMEGSGGAYRIEAPVGWVRFSLVEDRIVLTRDGLAIQYIEVARLPAEKMFPRTKKTLPASALPAEVAEAVLAELRARPGLANLTVVENAPATVAGRPGFRVAVRYRNDRGAQFERLLLGGASGSELLLFTYHALATHYFARDRGLFEQLVGSYRPSAAK